MISKTPVFMAGMMDTKFVMFILIRAFGLLHHLVVMWDIDTHKYWEVT